MILRGIEGQTVELKVANYQFPNRKSGDYYDDNWLNIFIKVDSKVGKWQTIDPSLLTGEVEELINWFSYLSENKELEYPILKFIEPNLSFELKNRFDSEAKKIRIYFDLEARPKSATDDKEYFVDFELNKMELKQVANDLMEELKKYPER